MCDNNFYADCVMYIINNNRVIVHYFLGLNSVW